MSETSVRVSLELVDKAAQKALGDFISNADNADKGMNKLNKSGSSAFSNIAVSIGKATGIYDIFVGNLAANLATKAFDSLVSSASALFRVFVVDGIAASQAQEVAINDLNTALAQTGIYSKQTSQDIQEFANQLQATTTLEDDVVLKNIALLQSLANLEKAGLKRASQAAFDLSSALGIDLDSAVKLVGKAATGEIGTFSKYGLIIEKGSTKAETFSNVLKTIESRFAGSAASKVNTYAGSLTRAQNAFGDLTETIGDLFVKNNVVIDTIKEIGSQFVNTTGEINSQTDAWKVFVGEGVILAVQALQMVVVGMDAIGRIGKIVVSSLEQTFAELGAFMVQPFIMFSDEAKIAFDAFTMQAEAARKDLEDAFMGDSVLGNFATKLGEVEIAARKGMDALKNGVETAKEPTNGLRTTISATADEAKRLREELKAMALDLAKESDDPKVKADTLLAALEIQHQQELISEKAFLDAKAQVNSEYLDTRKAQLDKAMSEGLITRDKYAKAETALERQRILATMRTEAEKTKLEKEQQKTRSENLRGTLGYIATLQDSSSKELFAIGKAAALATAYIDGQAAVVKALASAPPPFNYALAAAVGAAAAVNIGKIASSSFGKGGSISVPSGSPPSPSQQKIAQLDLGIAERERKQMGGDESEELNQEIDRLRLDRERLQKDLEIERLRKEVGQFATGGLIPGSSFAGDALTAKVNSGEMILNRQQQSQLFKIAQTGASDSGQLSGRIERIERAMYALADRPVKIAIDGREVFHTIRDQLNAGRSFA